MAAADQIAPAHGMESPLPLPGRTPDGQEARRAPEGVSPLFSRPGELDLFALILLIRAHLLRTILFALIALGLSVWYTTRATPRFSSTATIIIPARTPTLKSATLQQLGALDILGGGYSVYLDLLKSRNVQDALIQKFGLLQHFHVDKLSAAEGALAGETTMVVQPEGLLVVTVSDRDPKLAADLANAYSYELENLNGRLAIGSASQQRVLLEQQLIQEKNALADAEGRLAQLQVRTGIVVAPESQASQETSTVESIRGQIRSKQIQLDNLRQGETDQNPEVVRARAELAGLQGQLGTLQSGAASNSATGPTINNLPEQALILARAKREVAFHEGQFDALNTQFQTAKEQEGKDLEVLQVLDPAIPAAVKDWPPRVKYAEYALLGGFAFGIVFTLLEAFVKAVMTNPLNRTRLRALVVAPRG